MKILETFNTEHLGIVLHIQVYNPSHLNILGHVPVHINDKTI